MNSNKYYIFLSIFPTADNQKDGYIRRVQDIEKIFEHEKRLHLDISLTKNLRKKRIRHSQNLEVIYCNAFLHVFLILSLLRSAKVIYAHSIWRLSKILPLLWLTPRSTKLVIDVHGAVPEELRMKKHFVASRLFEVIEKMAFKKADLLIHVTEAMGNFYSRKYPGLRARYAIYYITTSASATSTSDKTNQIREKLNIDSNHVVIMYSGNCQVWQNIDLMLQLIAQSKNENYRFLILTGEPDVFQSKIANYPSLNNIAILSVPPEELSYYYSISHYGFILRDDSPVNIVANPTKLGEYLEYGLIPVVKFGQIGDYYIYDYEHISHENFDDHLTARKSVKNQEIFEFLKKKYKQVDLKKIIDRL